MKKKLTAGLALAMVLVLATAVALAWGLGYSSKASATLSARDALMKRYGLTQDMVRMFEHEETTQENGKNVTVYYSTFQSTFINAKAMGTYTVVTDKAGNATVTWSHDDADPAVWQNGDLTSPVWGAPQMQQSLDRYAAYRKWWAENETVYDLPLAEQQKLFAQLAKIVAPLTLDDQPLDPEKTLSGEADGTVPPNATPEPSPVETPAPTARPGDISVEQAIALARQAMADAYNLSEQALDAYELEVFYQFDSDGNCCVMFYGTESMGSVTLRPTDGQIQEVVLDSGLGGKG